MRAGGGARRAGGIYVRTATTVGEQCIELQDDVGNKTARAYGTKRETGLSTAASRAHRLRNTRPLSNTDNHYVPASRAVPYCVRRRMIGFN